MMHAGKIAGAAVAAWMALATLAGCSPQAATAPTQAAPAEATAPAAGFRETLTMQELMAHVVDPAADGVWLRQGFHIDADGERELYPTTDEGWLEAENAAAAVAESANLLLTPARRQDEERWVEYSQGLYDAGITAMKAAEARDKQAFFDAGGQIYQVCRACHARYVQGMVQEFE